MSTSTGLPTAANFPLIMATMDTQDSIKEALYHSWTRRPLHISRYSNMRLSHSSTSTLRSSEACTAHTKLCTLPSEPDSTSKISRTSTSTTPAPCFSSFAYPGSNPGSDCVSFRVRTSGPQKFVLKHMATPRPGEHMRTWIPRLVRLWR
ncbi:hypothetical protein DOTSEDRAFT_72020 [Dothistroma septosporum NZE10]|uniref:Uncharacterized protein n=1 Tax=Dothistroma septosporum (strain NZE10 / CBS 128990) TaxID=675120 RepID=N1PM01_DOTSN|nr:hypothetical protein DOTSEDRAFT_72020 [Dothistroma septosporum NZE10]